MTQIKAFGPDAEVLGGAIHGFIMAVNKENIWPHLEKLDMTDIDPNAWYPKQKYIDLWNSIAEDNESAMFDFVSIGMTIAQNAWPKEMDELEPEDVLAGWGDTFDAVNRGEDRGYVRAEKVEDKHWMVRCYTPDPDDLNYGVAYGFSKRFLPQGTRFTVFYDEDVPRRDEGGEETIIHIQWE
jgi:hypothetical protein